MEIDNAAGLGDSGGMVTETFSSSSEFHGILTGISDTSDLSWFTRSVNVTNNFP